MTAFHTKVPSIQEDDITQHTSRGHTGYSFNNTEQIQKSFKMSYYFQIEGLADIACSESSEIESFIESFTFGILGNSKRMSG